MTFGTCLCRLVVMLLVTLGSSIAHADVAMSKITLQAGTSRVTAEVFQPRGQGGGPAVVVLHGAGGTLLDGPEMRRVARHLAEAGNAVYVVHYFGATGTLVALDSTMQKNFAVWRQTVRDSVAAVQALRQSAAPVGVYGYSLGAFLALAAASDNPRVGAVVEHAGGAWNSQMQRLGKLPPVLMIHGKQDGRVPFAKYATPLVPVLRQRAVALETRFFPDEGHGFTQEGMVTVREAAAQFFRRHLVAGKR